MQLSENFFAFARESVVGCIVRRHQSWRMCVCVWDDIWWKNVLYAYFYSILYHILPCKNNDMVARMQQEWTESTHQHGVHSFAPQGHKRIVQKVGKEWPGMARLAKQSERQSRENWLQRMRDSDTALKHMDVASTQEYRKAQLQTYRTLSLYNAQLKHNVHCLPKIPAMAPTSFMSRRMS